MRAIPDVTVVIPTTGRWRFVETALRTVRLQEGVSTEVIVVVNGPRAHEPARAKGIEDDGVRVLTSIGRGSQADARNRGIALARGRRIAFLDDDDMWAPDKLASQLAALDASGADFAYSACAVVDPRLELRWVERAPAPEELRATLLEHNPIPACSSNLVVDAAVARRLWFDPEFNHVTDWDFALRLILTARGASVPAIQVGYLWHADSLHTAGVRGVGAEFSRFREKHAAEGRQVRVPSESRWNAAAHRERGRRARAAREYLRAALRHRSPSDLARAGVVLLGERAMRAGSRTRRSAAGVDPEWLALYRA